MLPAARASGKDGLRRTITLLLAIVKADNDFCPLLCKQANAGSAYAAAATGHDSDAVFKCKCVHLSKSHINTTSSHNGRHISVCDQLRVLADCLFVRESDGPSVQ